MVVHNRNFFITKGAFMNKKKITRICIAAGLALTLIGTAVGLVACPDPDPDNGKKPDVTSDTLYVKKVDGLSDDFIMGMDASCVPALEASGVQYRDFDGEVKDVYEILSNNGINYIRVRVWNDPYDSDGNGYGGGNCDIDNAIEIGKRATANGMKLLVDFHYSDFWADPAKQMVPKAWAKMSVTEKADALYNYTVTCLEKLVEAGVDVGMVQIGNETNGYFCGHKVWSDIATLMRAGSQAVREVCPDALVAVHFANPEKTSNYRNYAYYLAAQQVDYDVFASSYYPYWHGTLENLSEILTEIATTYGKKVMVAETSYAFTPDDSDFSSNTIGEGGAYVKDYPFTVQGQANLVRDVIDTVAHIEGGIGVFYWEGTWITVGTESWEINSALWEKHGSGWASSYSTDYDPNDAGKYYGGCAVDNQAFFDSQGRALESLKIFSLVRDGNEVEIKTDALEEVSVICDINGDIVLPSKVNAIMSDNSRAELPVEWENVDTDALKTSGIGKYDIKGTAGGMTTHCYLSLVEYNFLKNWSFEDDAEGTGWTATQIKKFDQLYVEDKLTDSVTGSKHYHFWGSGTDTVEFTLEQTLTDLKAGKYYYAISIMGGDCGETEVYAYVKVNGTIVYKAETEITVYNEWHTAEIHDIQCNEGDEITVGIYVKCAGTGAWGKIDDALLNSVKE